MGKTQVRSPQIGDGEVNRADLNVATPGSAVVAKLIQGNGIALNSTGADAGTGDVTITVSGIFVVGTNNTGVSTALGDAMYILNIGNSFSKARADSAVTYRVKAFATAVIANGASGLFQIAGILTGLSGLTPGSDYFLSPTTAGGMTVTTPSTAGHYIVRMGVAVSATSLLIKIEPPILLS